jgi:hypothetical protein
MKMTKAAWRALLREVQKKAKGGEHVTAIRDLYYALDRGPGLMETKRAVERLQAMEDLR